MQATSLTGWPPTCDQMLWDLVQEYQSDFVAVANRFAAQTRRDRFIRRCVFIDPDPFTRELCQVHYRFLEGKLSASRDQAEPAGFSIFDQRNLAVRLKSIYDEIKACVPNFDTDDVTDDDPGEPVIFGLEGAGEIFNPPTSDEDQFGAFRANFSDLPGRDVADGESETAPPKTDDGDKTPGQHDIDDDYDFWTHTRLSGRIHS